MRVRTWFQARIRAGSDQGNIVSTVIMWSMVILITFGVFQAGLYLQARTAATHAAEQGVDAARAQAGSVPVGIASATQFAVTSGGALKTPAVTGSREGAEASITVTGTANQLIPFFNPTISVTRSGPVERIMMPGERY